ncbi:hypothetical protein JCM10450v2_004019 [Rhodotorula kratochvilovae]
MRASALLAAPSRLFRTALITVPLKPASLLPRLRALIPDVRYLPFQGPDGDPSSPHPTAADYADADAILAWAVPDDLRDVKQAPRLRLWQGYTASYAETVGTEFFRSVGDERALTFASASGIAAPNIAEHVLGSVLTLTHKIHLAARASTWLPYSAAGGFFIRELSQLRVGIIGYGHIGRETARLFSLCGSRVCALTRSGAPGPEVGYRLPGRGDPSGALPEAWYSTQDRASTLDFLSSCDVIVNCLPDSAATRGFIGREELRAMKGDAIYVNVGRGGTTDQDALVEALRARPSEGEEPSASGTLRIGAVALDVVTPEPLPSSSPLWSLPNAIITMHWSGAASSYHARALDLLMENIRRIDAGEGALNVYRGEGVKP